MFGKPATSITGRISTVTCAHGIWAAIAIASVEILSIDQEEPAQLFTGFGKRSIGYRFAVAYPNTSCGRDWVERGGCEILPS